MSDDPGENTMTFWEHLEELRRRIFKMMAAFAVGAAIGWFFRERLLAILTEPFVRAWKNGHVGGTASLHFPAPAALFLAYIKLALLAGFIMALPIILYQVWAFVSPGLYSKEKRYALPFVIVSCSLFALGGYFGWRVVFPIGFQYLLGFSGPVGAQGFQVQPTVMIGDYIQFVTQMLLAFGSVFELPVVVFFLSVAGLVNHRHLIKFGRYFIVIAFALSAVLTPPDITSQILLAVPLCVLYLVSIGIAYIFGKKPEKNTEPT
jgi:sec-independent protein translocase protein TatC